MPHLRLPLAGLGVLAAGALALSGCSTDEACAKSSSSSGSKSSSSSSSKSSSSSSRRRSSSSSDYDGDDC